MDFEQEYSGSTKNVTMNVLMGKADAGASLSGEIAKETEDVRDQLRTIRKSGDIAPHPLSVHPKVPEAVRAAVKAAVLALAGTPEGEELLKQVRMPAVTAADYEKDYKPLEVVDVKGLSEWGK